MSHEGLNATQRNSLYGQLTPEGMAQGVGCDILARLRTPESGRPHQVCETFLDRPWVRPLRAVGAVENEI